MRTKLVVSVLLSFVAVGCASGGGPPRSDAHTSVSDRVAGWQADLRGLLPAVRQQHPALASGVPAALTTEITALSSRAASLDDDQLMVGVMRLMTHIAPDGHTGLFVWGEGNRPVHSLPLRWWFYPDGLYVEDGLGSGRGLAGGRVVGIAGRPLAEVLRLVDPLIPRETPTTTALLRPRYLLVPQVLKGLGLITDVTQVPLDLLLSDGSRRAVTLSAVPMAAYNEWAGPYGLDHVGRAGVRYLSRADRVLWHEVIAPRTLYIAYNRAETLDAQELDALRALAHGNTVDRIVVDIRHNYGGEVDTDAPLLDLLAEPAVGRAHRLYLLTGRNTFSAGALFAAKLVTRARVTTVGEPPSSGARSFGNAEQVELEHAGLVVTVATTTEDAGTPPTAAARPDLPVQLTAADYFAGRDRVLQAALDDRR
ncbi:MAG: hypothetical protein QOE05_3606 [Actinomycetota bacterium]|nr:hypothetical protein [Actinomycetota bacterium]